MQAIEILGLDEARKVFLKALVRRYFESEGDFQGGWFNGKVTKVEHDLKEVDTEDVYEGLLFLIRYEDGDKEHVTSDVLWDILVDRKAFESQLPGLTAANKKPTKSAAGKKREVAPEEAPHRKKKRPSDAENVASPATAAAALAAAADIDTPVEVLPLRDARTNSRQGQPHMTAFGPGGQRTGSKRVPKRKEYEDYETEDSQPRRGNTSTALPPSRFAPRGAAPHPSGHLPRSVPLATESNTPVPLDGDGTRVVGLPGHLKSIELVNFMCHKHMAMDFGNHVHFISGTNGSGKSAVLQALQCCLGVKASQTGRSSSMKNFVKTNAHEAIVRVTIWNKPYKGYDAFQHEVYGDFITVERKIAAVGSSSAYAMKDASGKTIARRRDDLDAMLGVLGINAANPVTVMTQDTARNFLAGSSTHADREKYEMYMIATQLGTIALNYKESEGNIHVLEGDMERFKKEVDEMQGNAEHLKRAVASLKDLDDWRAEQQDHEKVLSWTCVEEASHNVATVQGKLAIVPEREEQAQSRMEELQQEVATLQAARADKEAFLANFSSNTERVSSEAKVLYDRQKELHAEKVAIKRKLDRTERSHNDTMVQKESLVRAVEETQGEVAEANKAATQQYTENLEAAQQVHRSMMQQTQEQELRARETQAYYDEMSRKARELKEQAGYVNRGVLDLQGELQRLNQASRSKVALFGGQPMAALVAALAKEKNKFSRPPIGPIGQYLTLKDERWQYGVESCLGLQLNAFLVSNRQDQEQLTRMFNQFKLYGFNRPNICVMRLDLPQHTIPPHRQPAPHIPTVLRMLSCTNKSLEAPIFNYLVDTLHVESSGLASSINECMDMVLREQNVRQCLNVDGAKVNMRGQTTTTEPVPWWMKGKPSRLAGSTKDMVESTKQSLLEEQNRLVAIQGAVRQAEAEVASAAESARQERIKMSDLKKREWESQNQVHTLLSQLPPELDPTQKGVDDDEAEDDGLQREIFEATQREIELSSEVEKLRAQLQRAEEGEAQATAAVQAKKEELKRLENENTEFLVGFQEEADALHKAATALAENESVAAQLQHVTAILRSQLADQEEAYATMREMALQVCTEEDAAAAKAGIISRLAEKDITGEEAEKFFSQNILRQKIDRLRKKISAAEREAGGSLEELEVQLAEAEEALATRGRDIACALEHYKVLVAALRSRKQKLTELDQKLEEVVNQRFNMYMKKKNFLGRIRLDRRNRQLELLVQVDSKGSKASGAVRDLKQLSGGERSYTTVAFALALGGETNMPFRAMDEFDVFMDAVNRRVAMTNLLVFARQQSDLQFCFLTPQDMAAVEEARLACGAKEKVDVPKQFVKIVQMHAARANATPA